MSRDSVLKRGRAAAEAGMIDACLIEEATGRTTNSTGVVTTTWSTVYSGRCRVQESRTGAGASPETPGEAYVLMRQAELQLPVDDSPGVRADQRVTVTAAVHDADLAGRVFVIRGESAASEKTARRMAMEEVTS